MNIKPLFILIFIGFSISYLVLAQEDFDLPIDLPINESTSTDQFLEMTPVIPDYEFGVFSSIDTITPNDPTAEPLYICNESYTCEESGSGTMTLSECQNMCIVPELTTTDSATTSLNFLENEYAVISAIQIALLIIIIYLIFVS